ncbi:MAG TPA: hypothetical protein VJ577_12525 [Burkholderiaceae bacterium]|nr:hypothetical protein [Burkholderiaceae bacterium]
MHIVVIAWLYVVLMMSITEYSVTAGIMTFLLYGALPLIIILYVMGAPQRRRNRKEKEKLQREAMDPETQVQSGQSGMASEPGNGPG